MNPLMMLITLVFCIPGAYAEVDQIQVRATLQAVRGDQISVIINKRSINLPRHVADPDSLKVGKGKTIELNLRTDDINLIFNQSKNRAPASAKRRK